MTAAAYQVLTSQIDQSVNIVTDAAGVGFFEHRYVRRVDDYFIIYLSAQSGSA